MTTKYTKTTGKPAATPETPVFAKEIHHVRPPVEGADADKKTLKRDNIFSQSRDIREDRDARQVKTSHNPQTLPHGR